MSSPDPAPDRPGGPARQPVQQPEEFQVVDLRRLLKVMGAVLGVLLLAVVVLAVIAWRLGRFA